MKSDVFDRFNGDRFNGTGSETGRVAFDGTFRPKAVNGGPSNPKANGFFSMSGDEIVPLAIVSSFLGFGVEKSRALCTREGWGVWLFMNLRLGASSEYEECCSGETGWCYSDNSSWWTKIVIYKTLTYCREIESRPNVVMARPGWDLIERRYRRYEWLSIPVPKVIRSQRVGNGYCKFRLRRIKFRHGL